MRTLFFDDIVSITTWRGEGPGAAPAKHSCHARLLATVRAAPQCLQVVLLGSGLDARPWRLELPPGVRWFEVDRHDVLAAKGTRLRALGAELAARPAGPAQQQQQPVGTEAGGAHQLHAPAAEGSSVGQEEGREGVFAPHELPQDGVSEQPQRDAHPLRAASWQTCAVDLARRGWSRGLLRCGLDPRAPVCWVLEGLLYYLQEKDVRSVLKEAASVSAAGSTLAASVIKAPKGGPGVQQPGAASTSNGHAPGRPSDVHGPPKPRPGTGAGGADARKSYRLQDEFKWRCRQEIPPFFQDCGWQADALSWLEVAASYGLPTAEQTTSSVTFVTATLA